MTSCLLWLSFLWAKALPGVMILNSKSLTLWGNAVLAGLSEDSLAPVLYLAKGLCWTICIQNSSSVCFLSTVSLAKATGKGFFVIQWQESNREPPWGQKVGSAPSLEPRPLPLSTSFYCSSSRSPVVEGRQRPNLIGMRTLNTFRKLLPLSAETYLCLVLYVN